jgi:2-polyprenyl-6-methoxyphenol hydroxylase-like FAD-dependent oxidoreductase
MSPVAGVGINLAIQDAVAAANILAPILARRTPSLAELDRVQKRREFPTKVVQRMQMIVQNNVLAPGLRSAVTPKPPWFLYLLNRSAWLRQWPARFVGIGVRPEHVRSPIAKPAGSAPR